MRKENSAFSTAFVSEAGSFIDNRDYFAFVELDDMACYVIADGLDTDKEARSAEMAVHVVMEHFLDHPSLSRRRIRESLMSAHEWLKFESRRVRLKASLLVVVTDYTRMVWASCGSARMYHFRGGRLNLKSNDQSLSQLMFDRGRIAEHAVSEHEERGNLLNYMGKPDRFEPFVSPKTKLADGDVLLLCTPGVWEETELPEMLDALGESKDPAAFTDLLEDIVLSKQRQVVNNYTAAAVYVDKAYKEEPKKRWKWIKRGALALMALLLVGGGLWYMKAKEIARIAEAAAQMVEYEEDGDAYAASGDYAKALKAYSEAKNRATQVKDKFHFQLLRNKQKVSQMIVDGDGYVKDKDYAKALTSYSNAKTEAEKYKAFKAEHIAERIERTSSYARVDEVVKEGNLKFEGQDYTGALEIYRKAKTEAIEAAYPAAEKELNTKMSDSQEKLDKLEKETKTLRADKLEKKGDRSMTALDYTGAIESYTLAQEIYQEIDKLERVLAMERKIAKADEKLHPVAPAGSQPEQNSPPASASITPGGDKSSGSKAAEEKGTGSSQKSAATDPAGANSANTGDKEAEPSS